jgi:hypothetical protein
MDQPILSGKHERIGPRITKKKSKDKNTKHPNITHHI